MNTSSNIKLHFAPMEGVVDWALRDLMTSLGGIDQCITEFIRITDQKLPKKVYYSFAPELKHQSRTRSGTPVYIQLLGGNAELMALNAAWACELGAQGIDINFGCPAKLVNRNDGGAVLLQYPHRVYDIVRSIRQSVPANIPVTAKIRLGYEDTSLCFENAQAIESAGAQKLTIHCRTKVDGYKPPAYWEWIPKVKEKVKLPIIPNGEIWTVNDFIRCHEIAQCKEYMIGRGALANPLLFLEIKNYLVSIKGSSNEQSEQNLNSWGFINKSLIPFFDLNTSFRSEYYAQSKLKQWLRWMSTNYPEAQEQFDQLKVIHNPQLFRSELSKRTGVM